MEQLAEQGVIAVILGMILLAIGWVGRRLLAKGGMIERVVDTHVDYVKSQKQTQQEIKTRLCDHINDEDADRAALKRAGHHACEVATEVAERLGLSESAAEHIRAIKKELEAR